MTEEQAPTTVSTTESPASGDEGEKGKKGKKGKKDKGAKGKSNLVPAVVLALGIAAGGYFMGGSGGAADAATVVEVPAELEPGALVTVESMTVNLAGGRYLRISASFLMSSEFETAEDKNHDALFLPEDGSRVKDMLIAMFAGRDAATLVGADQLASAKGELIDRANTIFDGHVLEVYITEFVMQ